MVRPDSSYMHDCSPSHSNQSWCTRNQTRSTSSEACCLLRCAQSAGLGFLVSGTAHAPPQPLRANPVQPKGTRMTQRPVARGSGMQHHCTRPWCGHRSSRVLVYGPPRLFAGRPLASLLGAYAVFAGRRGPGPEPWKRTHAPSM